MFGVWLIIVLLHVGVVGVRCVLVFGVLGDGCLFLVVVGSCWLLGLVLLCLCVASWC